MALDRETMEFALEEVEKVRQKLEDILSRDVSDAVYNRAQEAVDEIPWIEDAIHRLAGAENTGGDPSEPGHPDNPRSL